MSTPAPPGWNKTVHDLLTEVSQGKRQQLSVNDDDFHWAIDYERSLLPPDTVFPRKDQVWETVRDCEVRFVAVFSRQGAQGGTARLQQAERVRILADSEQCIFVSFLPLRYHELQKSVVQEDIRGTPGYTGYLMDSKTAYFNEHFRLVEDVA